MKLSHRSNAALQPDPAIKEALEDAQCKFGERTGKEIYQLRLNLATPAVTTAEKSNAPAVGLPTLDGFFSYVAFRAALGNALRINSELSQQLLWQWNNALRDPNVWIDFQLPFREIELTGSKPLYDCSVGLPIDGNGDVLTPVQAFFTADGHNNYKVYPDIVDSIPLRRRVTEPFGRPFRPKRKLDAGSGSTKALDNRLYFPLTKGYIFFFRGDKDGVKRLLEFAINERIGLGKKTTLGYGQLASFEVKPRPDIKSTWTKQLSSPIHSNDRFALIKDLPYDFVFGEKEDVSDQGLFGCERFALVATIGTYGTYRPPYWLREQRTQIVRYGSIIQARKK